MAGTQHYSRAKALTLAESFKELRIDPAQENFAQEEEAAQDPTPDIAPDPASLNPGA